MYCLRPELIAEALWISIGLNLSVSTVTFPAPRHSDNSPLNRVWLVQSASCSGSVAHQCRYKTPKRQPSCCSRFYDRAMPRAPLKLWTSPAGTLQSAGEAADSSRNVARAELWQISRRISREQGNARVGELMRRRKSLTGGGKVPGSRKR